MHPLRTLTQFTPMVTPSLSHLNGMVPSLPSCLYMLPMYPHPLVNKGTVGRPLNCITCTKCNWLLPPDDHPIAGNKQIIIIIIKKKNMKSHEDVPISVVCFIFTSSFNWFSCNYFSHGATARSGPGLPRRGFVSPSDTPQRQDSSGRNVQLVAETSTWQHNWQETTSTTSAGFEPAIPASERPQTQALDRAAIQYNKIRRIWSCWY